MGKRLLSVGLRFLGCLVVAAIGAEVLLRAFTDDRPYIWPPGLRAAIRPGDGLLPGVSGPKRFSTNSWGLRGDEPPEGDAYRIVAIGGSTTECSYLDDRETWTHLVQEELRERNSQVRPWVGNAGRAGHTTAHHVIQVEGVLESRPQIDALLLLVGASDLLVRLARDGAYVPGSLAAIEASTEIRRQAFAVPGRPASSASLVDRSELVRRLSGYWKQDAPGIRLDPTGSRFVRLRRRRQAGTVRLGLPDLTLAIDEYRRNLGRILDLAARRRVRVILLTQPALWSAHMAPGLEELLLLGHIGRLDLETPGAYHTPADLALAMNRYNEALLGLCAERSAECIDLAVRIPRDTTAFYDDAHFNESGARLVAEVVAEHLAALPPFASTGGS